MLYCVPQWHGVDFCLVFLQSGSARVMDHDSFQSMIVVSKPSTSSLVSAYGLAKVRPPPPPISHLFDI